MRSRATAVTAAFLTRRAEQSRSGGETSAVNIHMFNRFNFVGIRSIERTQGNQNYDAGDKNSNRTADGFTSTS